MVGLTPHAGEFAARMLADSVAELDCFAKISGKEALLLSEVDDLAVGIEHDPTNMAPKSQFDDLTGRQ